MVKKIIIAFLFVIVIGLGAFGTYHFYSENKSNISAYNAEKTAERKLTGSA